MGKGRERGKLPKKGSYEVYGRKTGRPRSLSTHRSKPAAIKSAKGYQKKGYTVIIYKD